ncbi:MAG: nucleotide exchange factor GrpE [Fibrobacteres bacterium]|nr:nucleotide exchange factor GrpE [Fibrobacterota bacterium]
MSEEQKNEENKEESKPETSGAESCPPESSSDPIDSVTSTEAQIESLKAEISCAKDAKLRLLAEFDNYKRRTARESMRTIELANESLLKTLIPVLENFERALDPAHKEKDIEAFYKGVEMIYKGFFDAMKKAGVEEVNPIGEEFDSEKHEAVMQLASDTVPEHHIAQVLQKGYKLSDKMIQYAKVAVSTGKS